MKIEQLNPAVEFLKDELEARGLSKAKAAREMKIPPNRLSEITSEKKRISMDTAIRLERYLGIAADFWLRVQQNHELQLAKEGKKDELKQIKMFEFGS